MSIPRGSLRTFLESAKTSLHNAIINQQRVTLVMGNESADLDSITSAIVLAYLRSNSHTTPLTNPSVTRHVPPSQYPPLYIPLLNIPRADINIRPELLKLLPHANLEPSHLITVEDLNAIPPAGLDPFGKEELQPPNTRIILTDHNKLVGPLATRGFSDRVVGCIDHHGDEHVVPTETGSEPRVIETAGSCTSLVIRYCREAWDSLSGSASSAGQASSAQDDASVGVDDAAVRRTWDAQLARFAIASVLVDTTCLHDANKTEDVDRKAVEYLETKIVLAPGIKGVNWDRDAFFNEINSAKMDLKDLTLDELLRKDYKQWDIKGRNLGVSSVVKPLKWLIEQAGGEDEFTRQVREFAGTRKLDLCCIMTTATVDQEFRRELLVWSLSSETDKCVDTFESKSSEQLGLRPWEERIDVASSSCFGSGRLKIWRQMEVKNSRKQVAPLLREAMG